MKGAVTEYGEAFRSELFANSFERTRLEIVLIDELVNVVLIILTKINPGGFCEKNYFLRTFPVRFCPSRQHGACNVA